MGLVSPDHLDEPMSGLRGMFSLLLCFAYRGVNATLR